MPEMQARTQVDTQFKPGQSGNPAGRPPQVLHLIFTREMAKQGYDIAADIAEALKNKDWKTLSMLKDLMPYCFVQLRAKEFDIKPGDPSDSKRIAEEKREEIAKQYAEAKNEQSPS